MTLNLYLHSYIPAACKCNYYETFLTVALIILFFKNSLLLAELLGALSWSISMLAIPFVVSLCRKRSIRLLSIVGGLVMPLGILFTSFATEFGQVVFSYGAYT